MRRLRSCRKGFMNSRWNANVALFCARQGIGESCLWVELKTERNDEDMDMSEDEYEGEFVSNDIGCSRK